ncbi:MAG: helix-turn-helix transcriptional regulator [Acutalibacteraceae bacterium]|nr:helix-turn-helix transcriptional regulator [Acutalibacteraceae bacterium]
MNIKKELTKGSTALLVLSVLEKQDLYGYRIIKEIEMRSEFVFSLKEGTLYPLLHAFEKAGYVESYWQGNEGERRRKYYHLTKKGIKVLQENKQEWESYSTAVGKVIGGVANATT